MTTRIIVVAAASFFVLAEAFAAEDAKESLAAAIATLDGTVATGDEAKSVASQVWEDLQRRIQRANDQSTVTWNAVKSREDWDKFRDEKLAALQRSLGTWPVRNPDIRVEVTGEIAGDGFRIRNTLFESRPGWWVSANVYVPDPPRQPINGGPLTPNSSPAAGQGETTMPGIVICHAHHTPKQHGELQDMGMTWARAGCVVIVPDQVGHGERRQHPFQTAADYSKPYGVGRQDYYFRYDNAIQLHLVGESLIGWMAWDMTRCVDVLLKEKGIDPKRIVLLGSVAGGGDPAAVTGAVDERFAAVVPFNFGGPQPETRYPLPEDIEQSFNYSGSGGWESTRNLKQSAEGGFLPWVIVGGIAPRRLIYGHEFSWDRERDPVWKRLQSIYGLYNQPDSLAFTHGFGELKGQPPEASHCTHIGPPHRVKIHEAFAKWFGINAKEYSNRVSSEQLKCWTPEATEKLKPKTLSAMTTELADEFAAKLRLGAKGSSIEQRRKQMQVAWTEVLGNASPERLKRTEQRGSVSNLPNAKRWMLTTESGIRIPCLLLSPEKTVSSSPVILAVCSQGKNRLLKERAAEIAVLLEGGATICFVDPRRLGESGLGDSHTRRSSATSHSSTGLMLGRPLLGEQLRDIRLALGWLRKRPDVGFRPIVIWGESLIPPNPANAPFLAPRDDDQALPPVSEPQAPLLALLTALFEDDIDGIYSVGGLASWRSLLKSHLVLTAHDVIVPGALTTGDLSDILVVLQPGTRVRMDNLVDGWNRPASADDVEPLRLARSAGTFESARTGIAPWVFATTK